MFDDSDAVSSKRILIVEDEVEILSYYAYALADDYDIFTASSGVKAIEYVNSGVDLDIAIIDYTLPDISGLEILRKLKAAMPATPAIIITAYGDEDLAIRSFRSGASDYIKKPFYHDELLKKIELYTNDKTNRSVCECVCEQEESEPRNTPGDLFDPNYYRIQKAVKYINANFMLNITLTGAATSACLSKYYFSKIFKRVTGQTYQDYLNELRIKKAKELLSQNMQTITQVAQCVGYADITHFERIFKRAIGCTPSQYRAAHRPLPY